MIASVVQRTLLRVNICQTDFGSGVPSFVGPLCDAHIGDDPRESPLAVLDSI